MTLPAVLELARQARVALAAGDAARAVAALHAIEAELSSPDQARALAARAATDARTADRFLRELRAGAPDAALQRSPARKRLFEAAKALNLLPQAGG